jgi:DNA primase
VPRPTRHRARDERDEIRQRLNLVELISGHVALKKAGRQYKGLCPFHAERTPSFHVDPERSLFYCFGCHAGGDAFDFMMRIANQSFPEALAALAERTGVPLERTPEDARDRSEREQVLRALDAAAAFYRAALAGRSGETARDYLTRRGVRPETVEGFGLGYAPSAWDGLLRALAAKGYEAAVLDRAGLVAARAEGAGHFDLLRHRVIFPIEDLQDRTVAFGGRALDREATPKYLNSRESAAFQKGRLLYLLNRAREAIRETSEVVVVEGYMDALACHQAGVRNAVATLGTALTLDHALLLKRFAGRVTLVYDADAAGRLASERGAQLFEEAELPAAVAILPAGADPDGFLRREGPEKFRTILDSALSMFDYQVQLAELRHDARTLEGKVALADELLPVVSLVANPVRQSEYLRAIAQRFDLSEEALRQRLASRRRPGRRGAGESETGMAPPTPARWKAERFLLHLMVQEAPVREVVREELSVIDFLDPLHRKIVEVLLDEDAPAEVLRERLPDQESAELLNRLLFEPLATEEKDRDKVQTDSIDFFRIERLKEERRRIQRALKDAQAAGDEEQVSQLQSAFLALRERGQAGDGERGTKGGEEHGAEKGAGP